MQFTKLFSIFLVALIFFSIPIFAIGSSEGVRKVNKSEENSVVRERISEGLTETKEKFAERRAELKEQLKNKACEQINERSERIRCRLYKEDYEASEDTIPEACRLAENRGRCVALYSSTRNCY